LDVIIYFFVDLLGLEYYKNEIKPSLKEKSGPFLSPT